MPDAGEVVRKKPNILITGTPGAGKSYLCERVSKELGFLWVDLSNLAKAKGFIEEYDEDFECRVLDEDRLLDYMEPFMAKGGNLIEYHANELFPERWFQAVFVVTCNNTILYDRLKERGYNEKKLKSNLECEIFGTIYEEAMDSYEAEIVHKLSGETEADAEQSLTIIRNWLESWNNEANSH